MSTCAVSARYADLADASHDAADEIVGAFVQNEEILEVLIKKVKATPAK